MMSDNLTKLNHLENTKNEIRSAIQNKGVEVSDDDTFRSYAEKIDSITTDEVNNQDKTVTENGVYQADEEYSGLGTVTVNIPITVVTPEDVEAIQQAASNAQLASQEAENAQNSANSASESASNATVSASNAHIWAEGTDEEVATLGGTHSAKGWVDIATMGQIQSDWNQTDETAKDFIKNKPDFTGGGGSWGSITGTLSEQTDLSDALAGKLNSDYTNSSIPYVVATGYSDFYRYRRWSDGFLEQMGEFPIQENQSGWIDFPFPYRNTNYTCIVAPNYTGVCYDTDIVPEERTYSMWTYERKKDMCGITNYGPAGNINWYAYGKGAST